MSDPLNAAAVNTTRPVSWEKFDEISMGSPNQVRLCFVVFFFFNKFHLLPRSETFLVCWNAAKNKSQLTLMEELIARLLKLFSFFFAVTNMF